MPSYIKKARLKFQHQMPTESVDPPHKHTPIVYGGNNNSYRPTHQKIIRRRSQTSSKHRWHITLLFTLCWLNVSRRAQQHCTRTGKWNKRNKGSMSPTPRLRCFSWQCNNTIHYKWNDSCGTLRRILPLGKTSTELSRRTIILNKPRRRNIQKWSRAHHLLHNKTYNGTSFRNRTGCHVLQFPQSHFSPYHIIRNGPSATPN